MVLKGRWWTFLGQIEKPDGSPIRLGYVWGEPLEVQQQAEPSDAYVAEVHARFVASVVDLFERHKGEFGYAADEVIEIVSAKRSV